MSNNNDNNEFDFIQASLLRIENKIDSKDVIINQLINDVNNHNNFISTFNKGRNWVFGVVFTTGMTFFGTSVAAHNQTLIPPYITEKPPVHSEIQR